MAYTAKYASAFYGPFREALASAPKPGQSCNIHSITLSRLPIAYGHAGLGEAQGHLGLHLQGVTGQSVDPGPILCDTTGTTPMAAGCWHF